MLVAVSIIVAVTGGVIAGADALNTEDTLAATAAAAASGNADQGSPPQPELVNQVQWMQQLIKS